jgi:hypothetical protein
MATATMKGRSGKSGNGRKPDEDFLPFPFFQPFPFRRF